MNRKSMNKLMKMIKLCALSKNKISHNINRVTLQITYNQYLKKNRKNWIANKYVLQIKMMKNEKFDYLMYH